MKLSLYYGKPKVINYFSHLDIQVQYSFYTAGWFFCKKDSYHPVLNG